MRPAARMVYSAAGRSVFIDAKDEWSAQSVVDVFDSWFFTPIDPHSVATPDVTIEIQSGIALSPMPGDLQNFEIIHGGTCYTDNQTYYLDFDGSRVIFGPGTARQVQLWVNKPGECSLARFTQLLSHALSPALRRCGVFEIHSGGVLAPGNEKAIMIAGPSGSGKSTLTSQLARCGWRYLSDDILLMHGVDNEIKVQAFRRFFALTAETLAAAKLSRTDLNSMPGVAKERVVPEDHFDTIPVQQATPGTICFVGIASAANTSVVALTPSETMAKLLRLCPWASYDKPTSGEHLRTLGLLAQTTSAFDLRTGVDVLEKPETVAAILSEIASTALSV